MGKLRLLLAAGVLLVLGVAGSAAVAATPAHHDDGHHNPGHESPGHHNPGHHNPGHHHGMGPGTYICTGGTIDAGTYEGLLVTGNCVFGTGNVTINGDVRVAAGAILNDHAGTPATTALITGDVYVEPGAVLGLGTYAPGPTHDVAVVGGSIGANAPASLYLSRVTVHGSVVSSGGSGPHRNFPIKDDTIQGNLLIDGWSGFWLGVIRTTVGGDVTVSHTSGTQTGVPGTPFEGILDSTEVATNTIGGNLSCYGNTPPAQLGDAVLEGGGPNVVAGHKLGECAGL